MSDLSNQELTQSALAEVDRALNSETASLRRVAAILIAFPEPRSVSVIERINTVIDLVVKSGYASYLNQDLMKLVIAGGRSDEVFDHLLATGIPQYAWKLAKLTDNPIHVDRLVDAVIARDVLPAAQNSRPEAITGLDLKPKHYDKLFEWFLNRGRLGLACGCLDDVTDPETKRKQLWDETIRTKNLDWFKRSFRPIEMVPVERQSVIANLAVIMGEYDWAIKFVKDFESPEQELRRLLTLAKQRKDHRAILAISKELDEQSPGSGDQLFEAALSKGEYREAMKLSSNTTDMAEARYRCCKAELEAAVVEADVTNAGEVLYYLGHIIADFEIDSKERIELFELATQVASLLPDGLVAPVGSPGRPPQALAIARIGGPKALKRLHVESTEAGKTWIAALAAAESTWHPPMNRLGR